MGNIISKRGVQLVPALIVILFLFSDARPAYAGCFMTLKDCYYEAAGQESWVDRWLSGLDCELDFIDCTRKEIMGR